MWKHVTSRIFIKLDLEASVHMHETERQKEREEEDERRKGKVRSCSCVYNCYIVHTIKEKKTFLLQNSH